MVLFPRGTVFGPYTIGDLLGSGLGSEVYEASTADGAVVAIKVLKEGARRQAKREARLGQEGFALADVVHVNVAGFRGEGTVDGRVYLAMERVYGIDLRRLLAEAGGLLPLARAVRIAYQAADGLAAVHERGFLHRDVKPENILVTPDDLVKITDFGSAWVGTFGVATTREQDLTSMLYASPEHLRGRGVGPASDVYALGLVLYEMAAGVHPIAPRPASGPEIFTRQLVFVPPALCTLSSDERPIPGDLSDLVVRMIDKDQAKRPLSSELGGLLQAVLRPLLARHRAGAGGSIVGRTTPMTARGAGGTIRMAVARVAPASEAASGRASDATGDVPSEAREALPPPAPFDDGAGGGAAPAPPRAPVTAWDPAAATLRSAVRAPVTMPMSVTMEGVPPGPPAQPAERRSTAAPVERSASRASLGPRTGRRAIAMASVVLGLGAAGAAWFAGGRDGTAPAATMGGPQRSPQPPPVLSASASASAAAVETAAPRVAPAPLRGPPPRPAPRRGKIPVP